MSSLSKIFKPSYVLASKSPRRIQLLKQIGFKFISIDSRIKELSNRYYNPIKLIKYNSEAKSRKVAEKFTNNIIIGADTIVVLNNEILNKPGNLSEAVKFLRALSNTKHLVYTGINILNTGKKTELFIYEKTSVYFRELNDEEIKYYVKNHKPLDKAGAYGIQDDFGCLFIEKIIGDYYNIMGLPLVSLYKSLLKII